MEAWVGGFVSKEHSEFGSVARGEICGYCKLWRNLSTFYTNNLVKLKSV